MSQDQLPLPKKRGCFRNCFGGCLVIFIVLAVPSWWFCLLTMPLRISEKTTYVTSPKTSDGKRIDYFRAMEERYYPPEMNTDDNGYRLIVHACGVEVAATSCCPTPYTGKKDPETFVLNPLQRQLYEKLGLEPPTEKPTMKIESPVATEYLPKYDSEHPPADGEEEQSEKFRKVAFWTFDDFPMLKDWLDENTAGIDLLGGAVRKPAFFIPYIRESETSSFFDIFIFSEVTTPPKGLTKAVEARAKYRLGIGDIDGAIYDVITIHLLARHFGKQGTVTNYQVGAMLEMVALSIAIDSNPQFPPTKEQVEHLIAELKTLPPRWTWRDAFESERYFVLGNLLGDYWGYTEPYTGSILSAPAMRWIIDINIFLERVNKIYDAMIVEGATVEGKTFEEIAEARRNPSVLPFTARSRSILYADMIALMLADEPKRTREIEQRNESAFRAELERLQSL